MLLEILGDPGGSIHLVKESLRFPGIVHDVVTRLVHIDTNKNECFLSFFLRAPSRARSRFPQAQAEPVPVSKSVSAIAHDSTNFTRWFSQKVNSRECWNP